jgi:hypothetical protein
MAISFSTIVRIISFSVSIVIPKIVLGFNTEPLALMIVAPVEPILRANSTTSYENPAFIIIYSAFNSFILISILKMINYLQKYYMQYRY